MKDTSEAVAASARRRERQRDRLRRAGWIHVGEVAERLGLSRSTILGWVACGKLRARRIGERHNSPVYVDARSIAARIGSARARALGILGA